MLPREIVLPATEPETEWVRGRPVQKVSPTRDHAILQGAICAALRAWAGSAGDVGTEWRFRIGPPGEAVRPLVPDVAYVAAERLRGLTGADLQVPRLAPDAVVEILSPDDRRDDVDDKIATYLRAGSALVIVVDPRARTAELHDPMRCIVFHANEVISHAALPGFTFSLADAFQSIKPWPDDPSA